MRTRAPNHAFVALQADARAFALAAPSLEHRLGVAIMFAVALGRPALEMRMAMRSMHLD